MALGISRVTIAYQMEGRSGEADVKVPKIITHSMVAEQLE